MHYEILPKTCQAYLERRPLAYCLPEFQASTPFQAWQAMVKHRCFQQRQEDFLIVPCLPTGGMTERGANEFVRDWSQAVNADVIVRPKPHSEGDVEGEHIPFLGSLVCEVISR